MVNVFGLEKFFKAMLGSTGANLESVEEKVGPTNFLFSYVDKTVRKVDFYIEGDYRYILDIYISNFSNPYVSISIAKNVLENFMFTIDPKNPVISCEIVGKIENTDQKIIYSFIVEYYENKDVYLKIREIIEEISAKDSMINLKYDVINR
jgi:hypothetical protein